MNILFSAQKDVMEVFCVCLNLVVLYRFSLFPFTTPLYNKEQAAFESLF